MAESTKDTSRTGADSPTTDDLLGYKRFADNIAERISNSSEKDTPFTYGVYGEWGSGKTSFLKMVDKTLQGRGIYSIWFNAWKYDQEDNLWSALIQTILDQTRVNGKWYRRIWIKLQIWRDSFDFRLGSWEIIKKVLAITLRITIVGFCLLLIFGWSSSQISTFLNQFFQKWFSSNLVALDFFQTSVVKTFIALIAFFTSKPDDWIKLFDVKLGMDFSKLKRAKSYRAHIAFLDEFSEEFKRIIKLTGNGKPLVVIIDDLDRCLPEKAIQVLEAIKLFLDVEGCIFLLAVDRDVVEKAIAVKYKELLALSVDSQNKTLSFTLLGENYFEKIVQLPFALPAISDKQFRDFITNVYPNKHIQLCSEIFVEGLHRNPRKVKRLLQTFLLLESFANDGINNGAIHPSLIAKIVLLQSQFRAVYEELSRFNTLLAELEKYYVYQTDTSATENPLDALTDPILQEKIKEITTKFPALRKIMLKKVNDNDTFVGVDIEPYLSLTESTAEVKSTAEVSSPDTNEAIGQYLRNVIETTQEINLQSIDTSIVSSTNSKLARVFIAPKLSVRGDESKRIEAAYALKRTARSVILGSAGSGKSSLLLYWANIFARSFSQGDTSLVSQLGLSENLFPILIHLRRYGLYARAHEKDPSLATPVGFLDFLNDNFNSENINLPSGFFIPYLERGTCILLLDGLDEVSVSERQPVMQAIISLSKRYPTARIIVTSRPAAYFPGLGEDFSHYEIMPFDDNAIKEFVMHWLSSPTDDVNIVESRSSSLLTAIMMNDDLHALALNPLMLTIMVTVYKHKGELPSRRAVLYEDVVNLLLEKWDVAKGINVIQNKQELNLYEAKSLLAALAFSALDNGRITLDESFIISVFSNEMVKKGLPLADANSNASSLLIQSTERAGILIATGTGIYQFAHQIFQEYLASIALSDNENYPKLVFERYKNDLWKESIRLSVARVARGTIIAAENILQVLLDTQNPEGILLAGSCLLEIMPIMNSELHQQIIKSLETLIADNQVDESFIEQGRAILKKIQQAL